LLCTIIYSNIQENNNVDYLSPPDVMFKNFNGIPCVHVVPTTPVTSRWEYFILALFMSTALKIFSHSVLG